MDDFYRYFFHAAWFAWAVYWVALSRNVKAATQEESVASRLSHIVPLILAFVLFEMPGIPLPVIGERFLPNAAWTFWLGAGVTLAGLLFTVWARHYIGRNWSGTVTIKEDHELITSGPYAMVRHPIYTGLLLGFAGTAIARGSWLAVLAVAIAFAALWRKLRFEERWMRAQFGDAYRTYSARVAALVPFVL